MKINRRKLKKYHPIKRLFFYVSLVPLFTSCVYYNTFYNAEKSFENATKLIEESPLLEEGEIPPQAKKLLDEAIVNSYVVLDKYPESKYVDDAYFIIANSHFIKGEFTLAEDYLIRLKNEFQESKFIGETRILLAYCHYKLDELDQLGNDIKEITETELPSKYQFYLIDLILMQNEHLIIYNYNPIQVVRNTMDYYYDFSLFFCLQLVRKNSSKIKSDFLVIS